MAHYVLIDNCSGYVWGEACRIVDAEIGGDPREYEESNLVNSTVSGYHVHLAPAGWIEVEDGQSEEEIDRVSALPRVTQVAFTRIED